MQQQNEAKLEQNLLEQLDWQVAERNDEKVAQALYAGEPVDGVHTLDEAGLLDEFFAFLESSEILEFWKRYLLNICRWAQQAQRSIETSRRFAETLSAAV